MFGYWFNQSKGYFTPYVTIKQNRRYLGIKFIQDVPLLPYTVNSKYNMPYYALPLLPYTVNSKYNLLINQIPLLPYTVSSKYNVSLNKVTLLPYTVNSAYNIKEVTQ